MVHDKEEQARLIRQASKQAIALAIEGRWREAAEANKGILESFPNDVDTLNRLGRAHIELGEYAEARADYTRAKELDPFNTIADKNLRRLAHLDGDEESPKPGDGATRLQPNNFIEETGKAGVVRLQQIGRKEVLAKMVAGDKVDLQAQGANLVVKNEGGDQLGVVESRHGQRLMRLMAGGNKYAASVTSSTEESISVIIREVYQHPSQAGQLSFPSKGVESSRPPISDKTSHRHVEFEEGSSEEPGYGLLSEEDEAEPEGIDEGEEEEEDQQ
jgi:tetratricopeptide (TPR) repeat protein